MIHSVTALALMLWGSTPRKLGMARLFPEVICHCAVHPYRKVCYSCQFESL